MNGGVEPSDRDPDAQDGGLSDDALDAIQGGHDANQGGQTGSAGEAAFQMLT